MIITHEQPTGITNNIASSWNVGYLAPGDLLCVGSIRWENNISETKSVSTLMVLEPDLSPYEYMRLSGILAFWNEPEEDIYTFDDGQPVETEVNPSIV